MKKLSFRVLSVVLSLWIVLWAFFAVQTQALQSAGTEILQNQGFEQGTQSWVCENSGNGRGTLDVLTDPHSGLKSGRLLCSVFDPNGWTTARQYIIPETGATYKVALYYKSTVNAYVQLFVQQGKPNWTIVAVQGVSLPASSNWAEAEFMAENLPQVPVGGEADLRVTINGVGQVIMDDLSVVVSQPEILGSNLIHNSGLELGKIYWSLVSFGSGYTATFSSGSLAHSGAADGEFVVASQGTGGYVAIVQSIRGITTGHTYDFSVWYKSYGVTVWPHLFAVSESNITTQAWGDAYAMTPTNDWKQTKFTIGPLQGGVAYLELHFDPAGLGTFQFDDVSLSDTAVPVSTAPTSTSASPPQPTSLPTSYTLTIDPTEGGTTVPTSGHYSHPIGTQVTLTASANEGYTFACWTINGHNNASSRIDLVMTENKVCQAFFQNNSGPTPPPTSPPTTPASQSTITPPPSQANLLIVLAVATVLIVIATTEIMLRKRTRTRALKVGIEKQ